MFSRIETNGFIINRTTGSVYISPEEWDKFSRSEILVCLISEGFATYSDLSDPYSLYDKFLFLDEPIVSLKQYLITTSRLPSELASKLIDGFKSYVLSSHSERS